MIAIVDYDAGNLKSVEKAFIHLGHQAEITRDPKTILSADHVVLPGVGAFGDAMEKLCHFGLDQTLHTVAERHIPLLGICLGLQLFFEDSEESPGVKGLCLLPGHILRIPEGEGRKIPHMGWNSLRIMHPQSTRLFAGIPEESYVYFVHSYYLKADREEDAAARTTYGVSIDAAVERGNLFACQFHPEKSSAVGLRILSNFAAVHGA